MFINKTLVNTSENLLLTNLFYEIKRQHNFVFVVKNRKYFIAITYSSI